jgi:hypothetical protein
MKVGSKGMACTSRGARHKDRSLHCGTGVLARRLAFAGPKFPLLSAVLGGRLGDPPLPDPLLPWAGRVASPRRPVYGEV